MKTFMIILATLLSVSMAQATTFNCIITDETEVSESKGISAGQQVYTKTTSYDANMIYKVDTQVAIEGNGQSEMVLTAVNADSGKMMVISTSGKLIDYDAGVSVTCKIKK